MGPFQPTGYAIQYYKHQMIVFYLIRATRGAAEVFGDLSFLFKMGAAGINASRAGESLRRVMTGLKLEQE